VVDPGRGVVEGATKMRRPGIL